jgi:UDP-N-acetylglucosamine--N-acetylmuramyl-(pentapeptide) pyrophosphoryl-undecaprenol N-acetylglucosamine transferase
VSEPLRVLLTGGGTGGHIYALVAIARELLAQDPTAQVRFVGEAGRMEAELLPREGFQPALLDLPPANAPVWRRILLGYRWWGGWRAVGRLIADFRPQVVVGSGGQVCAPVLLAARRAGVPRVILEPNAIPGKANRGLAKLARANLVVLHMPKARDYFPAGIRVEEYGYPVRPAVLQADRATGVAALGLDPAKRTLLVFGGSLGSGRVNEALLAALPHLTADWAQRWQVLHLGGRVNARTLDAHQAAALPIAYRYLPYLDDMQYALAAADLAVGRAGATSLAEFTALGIPAILAPLPTSADDHQRWNAAWMADGGGAIVVPDADLTGERLVAELAGVVTTPGRLQAMAAASSALGRRDSATRVVQALRELAGG